MTAVANAVNRQAIREAVATIFSNGLVGTGKPCVAVYPYQKGKINPESPVVLVMSAGITRRRQSNPAGPRIKRLQTIVILEVAVYVADAHSEAGITEQDVENQLDLIEKMMADLVVENQENALWTDLHHRDEPSTIAPLPDVDGAPYIVESVFLEVVVDG